MNSSVKQRLVATVKQEILAEIFWWFCEEWSKIDIAGFIFGGHRVNVIIIHKIIPHPPIKTTVCPPVSHAVVRHIQLRKWKPHLQAPLPPNHWTNIDSQ